MTDPFKKATHPCFALCLIAFSVPLLVSCSKREEASSASPAEEPTVAAASAASGSSPPLARPPMPVSVGKPIDPIPEPYPSPRSPVTNSRHPPEPVEKFGNAVLVAPAEMDRYGSYTVTLKIAEDDLEKMTASVRKSHPEAVTGSASEVLMSGFIQAELMGNDFDISKKDGKHSLHRVNQKTGAVSDWHWTVSPRSWGRDKKLTAHIYSLDNDQSDSVLEEIATKEASVHVSVSSGGFIRDNASDIAKLILLPLAGWLLKQMWDKFQARRSGKTGQAPSTPRPDAGMDADERRRA